MSTAAGADMHLVPPPRGLLYHVGPAPNPFRWRLPAKLDLTAAITASGRFDAPNGDYATLYCATERYGALLEKLAPLRPIPDLRTRVEEVLSGAPDPQYDRIPGSAPFPADIFEALQMGIVAVDPDAQFIDVDDPKTHVALEKYGGKPLLQVLRISRIDRGTFLSPDRALTRRAAHELYQLAGGLAAGLRYTSAIAGDAECWAIWDHARSRLHDHDVEPIDVSSPDLKRALPRLGFKPPARSTALNNVHYVKLPANRLVWARVEETRERPSNSDHTFALAGSLHGMRRSRRVLTSSARDAVGTGQVASPRLSADPVTP
jgi:hypothetical protein